MVATKIDRHESLPFLSYQLSSLLQGQRKLHLGFCLKLLEMCFKHAVLQQDQSALLDLHQPQASIERLAQLQTFARGMDPIAAGLDIKPFLVPRLPAQLLLLVITKGHDLSPSGPEGKIEDTAVSSEEVQAGLIEVHVAALEELCLHCNVSNAQQIAELLHQLPSTPSVHSTAAAEFEFELSASTAYTAAVCGILLEVPQLEPDGQTEACQEAADYLGCLTPQHLQQLLQWCALSKAHPLLTAGPQLLDQLPADLRLAFLQAGLDVLAKQAEGGMHVHTDDRLQLEARRLNALCEVQESCSLTSEQWGMVEQALTGITVAGADDANGNTAVQACLADLLSSGLTLEEVLLIASSLQSLVAVVKQQEVSKPAAAVVVTGVVQKQMTRALATLSASAGPLSSPQSLSGHSSDEGSSDQHLNGVAGQEEDHGRASAESALDCIHGILQSLQASGASVDGQRLVAELRTYTWTALQQHLFGDEQLEASSASLQPGQLQLLEAVLALSTTQTGLSTGRFTRAVASKPLPDSPEKAGKLPLVQWEDWTPTEGSSSITQGHKVLLVSRTRAVVDSQWPGAPVMSHELDSCAAAQKLFLKLLAGAEEEARLQALHGLLADIWQSGHAIASTQV